MFGRAYFPEFFLVFVVACCATGLFWATSAIQVFLMLICVLGLSFYIPFFIKDSRRKEKNVLKDLQYKVLHQAFEQFCEYAIFSIDGRLLNTSHPHLYSNLDDFLQKIDGRFASCAQWPLFKRWIDERHMGDMLLRVPQMTQERHRLLLGRVMPQDVQHYEVQAIFIGFEDVSIPFEEYESMHHELKCLQNFIDYAPFAMVCLDQSNRLMAFNQTFSQWVKRDLLEISNVHADQFIDGMDYTPDNKVKVVTIKPFKYPPFKALWFPSLGTGKSGISLLCRMDNFAISMGIGTSDETFLKAAIPGVIINRSLKVTSFNQSCQQLIESSIPKNSITTGCNFAEFINQSSQEHLKKILASSNFAPLELALKDGKIHCIAYISKIGVGEFFLQLMDISQQKRLEQQFIQSQKMQAIGQLAGGIAHDFNNLLTAMIGFCDLLLQRYMPNDPSYLDVSQIKQNANRAANLVRQLLAFSRQQTLQPRIVNITDSLTDLSSLLRRLIGAKIELDVVHGREIWPVKVDVSQFEQVIINLAVNSRDAMLDGGKLVIKTSNVSNKQEIAFGNEMIPVGDFVVIDVSDTGCGIPEEHLEHIFEPFFSTKEVGAGTGLGLSTVYGIVKQTGGFIFVDSHLDKGTNFRICLPPHMGTEVQQVVVEVPSGDLSGSGTILLVEDEDAVRMFSARALRDKGYKVIEASNGEDALELVKKGAAFDLLVTDVVMPQMDGPELSNRLRSIVPNLKTIFISGYAEDAFRKNLDDDTHIHFLPKPFTLKDLAAKVRDIILH